jgi:hypothetical protein
VGSQSNEDFVREFFRATEGIPSPDQYRIWSGISLVAAAMERRVSVKTFGRSAFCNMYVMLVGAPGVGKGIVNDARKVLVGTTDPNNPKKRAFHVSPHNLTSAALMDKLAQCKQSKGAPGQPLLTYHSLAVMAEEFQLFMPVYEPTMIGKLNHLYLNEPTIEENRRYAPETELVIDRPQLNILCAAQPTYISSTFPEEAWSTGLARRIVMIYAGQKRKMDLADMRDVSERDSKKLQTMLGRISMLQGQLDYEEDSGEAIRAWHNTDGPPTPTHSKLISYNQNRTLTLTKLCAISHVARGGEVPGKISMLDFERARDWLIAAESLMPDVFREMQGKSDLSVIEELHLWMTMVYRRQNGKPIEEVLMHEFLIRKAPSDKVVSIIESARRAGVISNLPQTSLWVPRPQHLHGVE